MYTTLFVSTTPFSHLINGRNGKRKHYVDLPNFQVKKKKEFIHFYSGFYLKQLIEGLP